MSDRLHEYVFLDYEGRENLLSTQDLRAILERMENTLVFTIAVRDTWFHQDDGLLEYLNLIDTFPNLTFCIVAGHPAYASVNVGVPLKGAFYKIFGQIRQRSQMEVFLGAENLSTSLIQDLQILSGNVVPFFLHGDTRVYERNGDEVHSHFAVYSPIAHTLAEAEVLQTEKVVNYLLRRKSVRKDLFEMKEHHRGGNGESYKEFEQQILKKHIHDYILTSGNIRSKIQTLRQRGATLVVGNPVIPEMTSNLIEEFSVV